MIGRTRFPRFPLRDFPPNNLSRIGFAAIAFQDTSPTFSSDRRRVAVPKSWTVVVSIPCCALGTVVRHRLSLAAFWETCCALLAQATVSPPSNGVSRHALTRFRSGKLSRSRWQHLATRCHAYSHKRRSDRSLESAHSTNRHELINACVVIAKFDQYFAAMLTEVWRNIANLLNDFRHRDG